MSDASPEGEMGAIFAQHMAAELAGDLDQTLADAAAKILDPTIVGPHF